MERMKKHLITGLIILLPLALTAAIVAFMFNFLTDPFVGAVKSTLNQFNLFTNGFWIFSSDDIQLAVSRLLILVCLFLFTVILGMLARWFLLLWFLSLWDYVLKRIPLVRSIYKISQDVIGTIFSNDAKSFKQVVLVPYPHNDSYCIGFVTRDGIPALQASAPGDTLLTIFVPTTPNPTSGFLLIYKEKEVIFLDMKVDEAFKAIISCGVILDSFTVIDRSVNVASKSPAKEFDLDQPS